MLELQDLHVAYGKLEVVHGIELEVGAKEIVTLIGANGAGKSSTLQAISGLVTISSGRVIFDGADITGLAAHLITRRGLCHVPEGRRIMADMTVHDNLQLGAYLRRDKKAVARDLDHCYSLFPFLPERARQLGGTLSGGEQQMLAISRALMQKPKLLLLDEPSLGLAPLIVSQVLDAIKQINRDNQVPILLVEQNAAQALRLASRGSVLENGRISMTGPCSELLNNPLVQSAYLGL